MLLLLHSKPGAVVQLQRVARIEVAMRTRKAAPGFRARGAACVLKQRTVQVRLRATEPQ